VNFLLTIRIFLIETANKTRYNRDTCQINSIAFRKGELICHTYIKQKELVPQKSK